jgi:death on curing protein
MKEPRWISREECLALHEMLLLRYGGLCGVRDPALLDAVLARPRERFATGAAGLAEPAACYAAGIALVRPFVSGNLSSAFVVATAFLRSNGLLFTGQELPVVQSMLELAQGQISESHYALYLRCNCRPL